MFGKDLRKYLTGLLILTASAFILTVLYELYAPEQYVSKAIYFFAPFFFIISVAGKILLEYLVYKNSKWLNYSILGIRAAKFVIYLIVIILYAFYYRDDAVNFILTFFVFYLIFTFFDIKSMHLFLQKKT